jgi:phenylalanyl-tRNA synthetase beta chain
MRIYGYDHIVSTPIDGEIIRGKKLPERIAADTIKELLVGQSMREITTYSFISAKACDMLSLPADDARRNVISLLNPLGEDYAVMRTQLISSMATVLATNDARKNPAGRFFEVSKLFVPKALPLTEQPDEVPALSIGLYGEGEDFFTLKGIVEMLMTRCKLNVSYRRSAEPYLHPGRQAEIVMGPHVIGVLGELHPLTAEKFGIDTRAYVAEIKLEKLYAALTGQRTFYKPLPRHPASVRDLSVLAKAEMAVADIEAAIRKGAGKTLEAVKLFDVYQGKQVPEGHKSVSYSLTLRAPDRTLTVEECDGVMKKVLKALEEIGISMRS